MITVTAAAAKYFLDLIQNGQNNLEIFGIRIGVKPSGCAEYKYIIEFAHQPKDESKDIEFSFMDNKVKIFVDKNSLGLLNGTELDCISHGISQVIKFNNPRAVNECGCGESFSIREN